eukprot:scaffold157220_cov21-Tisochrysis_lutea.AAC.2
MVAELMQFCTQLMYGHRPAVMGTIDFTSDESIKIICAGLRKNKTVAAIDLPNNNITVSACKAMTVLMMLQRFCFDHHVLYHLVSALIEACTIGKPGAQQGKSPSVPKLMQHTLLVETAACMKCVKGAPYSRRNMWFDSKLCCPASNFDQTHYSAVPCNV